MPLGTRPRGATRVRQGQSRRAATIEPRLTTWTTALQRSHLLWALGVGLLGVFIQSCVVLQSSQLNDIAKADAAAAQPVYSPVDSSVAPVVEPVVEPVIVEPPWRDQIVKSGDTLSAIFKRAGFDNGEVFEVLNSSAQGKALARIFPGQTIAFQSDDAGNLIGVRHTRSALETATYRRSDDSFSSEVATRTPDARETWASMEIESSLFLAGKKAGLSNTLIMELANIFGGVIDFVLDPRKGDSIQVIYEDLYLDGEKYGPGNIVATSFTNRGETFTAYRYEDAKGDVGYYNEKGVSMRKAFLMAPVDFTRISSNFNPRRLHPIYKTRRPHRGIDYAAPRGTPVYAAGDGRVVRAGYSRANGNYVFIQHGEQYVTRYLHLHKRKVKQGQRVKQSQVIGSVGSTGAATGPHLHYEFLLHGVHRNPRTIHKKLPKAKSLPKTELQRFAQHIARSSEQLVALNTYDQLAMQESAGEPDATH